MEGKEKMKNVVQIKKISPKNKESRGPKNTNSIKTEKNRTIIFDQGDRRGVILVVATFSVQAFFPSHSLQGLQITGNIPMSINSNQMYILLENKRRINFVFGTLLKITSNVSFSNYEEMSLLMITLLWNILYSICFKANSLYTLAGPLLFTKTVV